MHANIVDESNTYNLLELAIEINVLTR